MMGGQRNSHTLREPLLGALLPTLECLAPRDSAGALLGEDARVHAGKCGDPAWWCMV